MTLGMLLMDALYLAGLLGLLLGAATVGVAVFGAMPGGVPLALVAALLAAGATWIAAVGLATALLPRPRAGRFPLMRHPVFFLWTLSFLLRRYLDIPPIQTIVFQSNVLRWLMLRLLGARIHFSTSMSSDVLLIDPALFHAGPGCILGAQTIFTGHLVLEGRLLLAPIRLGRDVEIGACALVGPGVEIGDGARVGIAASIGPSVVLGAGAIIGAHAIIDAGARLGKGARVLANAYVPPGTEVEDGEIWAGEEG